MSRAFTLIELMLVVVIIGILAALAVPQLAGRSDQARAQAAQADINATLPIALDLYELDMGSYPQNLDALRVRPADSENWHGPYLKKKPYDPWGRAYIYTVPGEHNTESYDLMSVGKDGQSGTKDDSVNWEN